MFYLSIRCHGKTTFQILICVCVCKKPPRFNESCKMKKTKMKFHNRKDPITAITVLTEVSGGQDT